MRCPHRIPFVDALAGLCLLGACLVGFAGVGLANPGIASAAQPHPARPTPPAAHNPFHGTVGGARLDSTKPIVGHRVDGPPRIGARSYVVADLDTGHVLAAKGAHVRAAPHGLLQALAATTLLPRLDVGARYTATAADARAPGPRAGLVPGQVYSIDELFYGLLRGGGHDAGHALATANGGVAATVRLMNQEAVRLGAFDTRAVRGYTNRHRPPGREAPANRSVRAPTLSAYDLALITRTGMKLDDFGRYVAPTPGVGAGGERDPLLTSPGLRAVLDRGSGLVAVSQRDGHRLLVAMLGDRGSSHADASALLGWAFAIGTRADPVGRLVTPDDVTRAARNPAARADRPAVLAGKAKRDRSRTSSPHGGARESRRATEGATGSSGPNTGQPGVEGAGAEGQGSKGQGSKGQGFKGQGFKGQGAGASGADRPGADVGGNADTSPADRSPVASGERTEQAGTPANGIGSVPLWLGALALVFAIMSGARIRTVVRHRHSRERSVPDAQERQ